ncbi:MAG: oligosaccharide flippase family protein [Planctomycetota bacterium]|nr:oligosaccharide flippase family protein [Planctomycetota bacterium]
MVEKSRLLSGAAVILLCQICGYGLSFIRNMILARLIGPEDFGTGAILALVLSAFEFSSDLGFGRYLVVSQNGEEPGLQKTIHSLMLVRSLVASLVLYLSAGPIAGLFALEGSIWAFRWLAFAVFVTSLVHTDYWRVQRDFRFIPQAIIGISEQVVSIVVGVTVAFFTRDFTAVLASLVALPLTRAITSNLVAERSFGFGWNRKEARNFLNFGIPICVAGVFVFGGMSGDRLLISTAYPSKFVGMLTVCYTLLQTPATAIEILYVRIQTPLLAKMPPGSQLFIKLYEKCTGLLSCAAGCLVILGALFSEYLIVGLYGTEYNGCADFIGWVSTVCAIRLVRVGLSQIAISKGDTLTALIANVARCAGLAGLSIFVLKGFSLDVFLAGSAMCEGLVFLITALRLFQVHGVPLRSTVRGSVPVVLGTLTTLPISLNSGIAFIYVYLAALVSLSLIIYWTYRIVSVELNTQT